MGRIQRPLTSRSFSSKAIRTPTRSIRPVCGAVAASGHALAAARARGVKLGNPRPRPLVDEVRLQGIEAVRQNADARAQQLSEILAEFDGQRANATAKALNDRGLPTARGGKWTAGSVINIRARLESRAG
jgi:hypothetical protein